MEMKLPPPNIFPNSYVSIVKITRSRFVKSLSLNLGGILWIWGEITRGTSRRRVI